MFYYCEYNKEKRAIFNFPEYHSNDTRELTIMLFRNKFSFTLSKESSDESEELSEESNQYFKAIIFEVDSPENIIHKEHFSEMSMILKDSDITFINNFSKLYVNNLNWKYLGIIYIPKNELVIDLQTGGNRHLDCLQSMINEMLDCYEDPQLVFLIFSLKYKLERSKIDLETAKILYDLLVIVFQYIDINRCMTAYYVSRAYLRKEYNIEDKLDYDDEVLK